MSFNLDNIPARESIGGMQGLRYSTKPAEFLKPQGYNLKPQWGAKLFETMDSNDRQEFDEESIETARFLDEKKSLAGKSRDGDLKGVVQDYEDRPRLAFDPVSAYQKEKAGHAAYDSGRFSGGDDLLKAKPRGFHMPAATLSQPNPYHLGLQVKLN